MKIVKNPVQGARLIKYPAGNIYQGYGENVDLYWKAIKSMGHNGIDIVSAWRTPLPMTTGLIVGVKNDPNGYGKNIRLLTDPDKDGNLLEIVYGHNDENIVNVGERVANWQTGGYMGNTGYVISAKSGKPQPYWGNAPVGYGVHLHFGVRPASLIKTQEQEGSIFYPTFGKTIYYPHWNNGILGYVDPLKYIEVDKNLAVYVSGLITAMLKKLEEMKAKAENKN